MQSIIAGIQDDHTTVVFFDGIYQNLLVNDVLFKYDDDGIYYIVDGARVSVVEIDDKPIQTHLDKIKLQFCNQTYSPYVNNKIAAMFCTIYNPLLDCKKYTAKRQNGHVAFKFEWAKNRKIQWELSNTYSKALFDYPINEVLATNIQYIQPINALMLTLTQGFLDVDLFQKIVLQKMSQLPSVHNVDYVIIDMRNNTGGAVDTEMAILQHLVDNRFTQLIRETSAAKYKETLPVNLRNNGRQIYQAICIDRMKNKGPKIVIVTNPNCYSACVNLIKSVKSLPFVIHIGKQTSKFQMNGNIYPFALPSSQGQLLIATYQETTQQYNYAPANYDIPDIELPFGIIQSRENFLLWISQNKDIIKQKMAERNRKLKK